MNPAKLKGVAVYRATIAKDGRHPMIGIFAEKLDAIDACCEEAKALGLGVINWEVGTVSGDEIGTSEHGRPMDFMVIKEVIR